MKTDEEIEVILKQNCICNLPEQTVSKIKACLPDENRVFGVLQTAHHKVCYPAFRRLNDDQQDYLDKITRKLIN